MNKLYIGIDPGANGGIASYNGKTLSSVKCPSGGKAMAISVKSIFKSYRLDKGTKRNILVTFERVHAFPHDARSSAFKFGMNYGMWHGIIGTMGLRYCEVTPQKWQAYYIHEKMEKAERKRYLKSIAQERFPDTKVTLAICDAILIAKFAHDNELMAQH